jgi:hypothetical protein
MKKKVRSSPARTTRAKKPRKPPARLTRAREAVILLISQQIDALDEPRVALEAVDPIAALKLRFQAVSNALRFTLIALATHGQNDETTLQSIQALVRLKEDYEKENDETSVHFTNGYADREQETQVISGSDDFDTDPQADAEAAALIAQAFKVQDRSSSN